MRCVLNILKVLNLLVKEFRSLIDKSFQLDDDRKRIKFDGAGYYDNDQFYKAIGRYSCFRTCNSWTNRLLKKSNVKSAYWTPYSFGITNKHNN